jgi:hypothetical protein
MTEIPDVPKRYTPYYRRVKGTVGIVVQTDMRQGGWQCLRCLEIIKPNTLGAQSHLMRHVRTLDRARRPKE